MIVDPDMPDHWKVQMLSGLLGDDHAAAVYLIRLWGHCQNRKKDRFDNLPAMALRAICKYQGNADQLEAAMIECGFIERDGSALVVVGWAEHNANLCAAWENGKKGGRPKNPDENPRDNPSDNPSDNPRDTGRTPDKEDKEDKEDKNKPRARASQSATADRFEEFWSAYPKKVKRKDAVAKWKSRRLDGKADEIIADVERRKRQDARWLRGFAPDPTTYINGSRWEDEIEAMTGPAQESNGPRNLLS